jgi:excisionase family DNA binding protein
MLMEDVELRVLDLGKGTDAAATWKNRGQIMQARPLTEFEMIGVPYWDVTSSQETDMEHREIKKHEPERMITADRGELTKLERVRAGVERAENARLATLENYYSEPVWNCSEASRFLRIHPATVKRLARDGKLPSFRIGNRWRFRPSELDAWARSTVLSTHSLRRE